MFFFNFQWQNVSILSNNILPTPTKDIFTTSAITLSQRCILFTTLHQILLSTNFILTWFYFFFLVFWNVPVPRSCLVAILQALIFCVYSFKCLAFFISITPNHKFEMKSSRLYFWYRILWHAFYIQNNLGKFSKFLQTFLCIELLHVC